MNVKTTGAMLAIATAALISTGCNHVQSSASSAKVHCAGLNACKGQGACKTANNACGGHNACKGQGWVEKTAEECKAEGGTVI